MFTHKIHPRSVRSFSSLVRLARWKLIECHKNAKRKIAILETILSKDEILTHPRTHTQPHYELYQWIFRSTDRRSSDEYYLTVNYLKFTATKFTQCSLSSRISRSIARCHPSNGVTFTWACVVRLHCIHFSLHFKFTSHFWIIPKTQLGEKKNIRFRAFRLCPQIRQSISTNEQYQQRCSLHIFIWNVQTRLYLSCIKNC